MRSALFLLASLVATQAGAQETATIDIVRHDPAPSLVGHGIVVSTLITTSDGGAPTGSVSITDGIDGCTVALPQGHCLWVPGTSGTKSLVATYSGDATYPAGATSPPALHDVELPGAIERVSLGQGFPSFDPRLEEYGTNYAMSGDGRWVAFVSPRDGLVPGDNNGVEDVFVVDRMTGELERVSVSATGSQASAASDQPSISDDGNRIAFRSSANDLVAGDTDSDADIFVRDRGAATTLVASINNAATLGNGNSELPAISGNGEKVVFRSFATNLDGVDSNSASDVYVRDLLLSTTTRVSVTPSHPTTEPNGNSGNIQLAISFDGDRIAFDSGADNLLVGGDLNGACPDVFVRRLSDASTHLASVQTNGSQHSGCDPIGGLGISSDGMKLAFGTHLGLDPTDTGGFRDVYRTDLTNLGGTLSAQVVSLSDAETYGNNFAQVLADPVSLSGDGNVVAFDSFATNLVAGDSNSKSDVFVRDVSGGSTLRVSSEVGSMDSDASGGLLTRLADQVLYTVGTFGGVPGYPLARLRIRHFSEPEPFGLWPEFLGNQLNESSVGGFSEEVSTTVDGSLVAFTSADTHLVLGDQTGGGRDVFLRDRYGLQTERISVALDGLEGDGASDAPSISADEGRYVAFESMAEDMVVGDTNGVIDIFVRDRTGLTTERINRSPAGAEAGGGHSRGARISGDGRFVVFRSDANNLVASDSNNQTDLFLWDRIQPLASRIRRINLLPGGVEDTSGSPYDEYDISRDGRFVVFSSTADALVVGSNDGGAQDLYRYEIATSTTTLISLVANGTEGGAGTVFSYPRISDDGNHVAFVAFGNDIVTGLQTGGSLQAYVRDVDGGTNAHASRCSDGTPTNGLSAEPPGISGDGRYVSFKTSQPACASDDSGGLAVRVLAHDLQTQITRRVDRLPDGSAPNGTAGNATRVKLNNTGEFVLFASNATDLVLGDTNAQQDVFAALNPVFNIDAILDVETVAPAANNDSLAAASDASGRFVLFQTDANNLGAGDADIASDIVRVDEETGDVLRFSVNDDDTPITSPAIEPSVAADGDVAVFVAEDAGITALFGEAKAKTKARAKGAAWSVLLRNAITGTTQRMTIPAQPIGLGTQPQLAPSGTALVYTAPITDPGMGTPGQSAIIEVPLTRVGDMLIPGAPRCLSCKSVNVDGSDSGQNADGDSRAPTISADGRFVAWETAAKNLTVGTPAPCATSSTEIVMRDLLSGSMQRMSAPAAPNLCGAAGTGARKPKLDWGGKRVVFESDQPLRPDGGDTNGVNDVYLRDLTQPGLKRLSETAGGGNAGGASSEPTISGDGEIVAYVSAASNLDPTEPDINGRADAHVGSIIGGAAAIRRLSKTRSGAEANSDSRRPALNYNGTRLAFDSDASNLAPGADVGQQNVFQRANPLVADLIFGTGFE